MNFNSLTNGITLVIPIYNKEKYIRRCISSAINSYGPYDEIIIVDDSSTDHYLDEINDFFDKIRVIKLKNNIGPYMARLVGIESSSTEWVQLLDADDFLVNKSAINLTDKLILSFTKSHKISFVGFSENLSTITIYKSPFDFYRHGWPNQSSIIVNKKYCTKIIELKRLEWGEDHIFLLNLIKQGFGIGIPFDISHYDQTGSQRSVSNGNIQNRLKLVKLMYKTLREKYSINYCNVFSSIFFIRTILALTYKKIIMGFK